MSKRILGLDTGTNSLGWAVVDKLDNGQYSLIRKGCVIFPEGVKIEKNQESSRAAERTGHRSQREQYSRRRSRKIAVLRLLIKYKLCPFLSEEELREWHIHKVYPMNKPFMEWQRTKDYKSSEGIKPKNPYRDRHECLHRKLNLSLEADRYILGRALYHLAQRRGFLSNAKEDFNDEDPTGKVKHGISDLSKDMEEAGFEFLGDYFYYLYATYGNLVRIRNRYTDRIEQYQKEFDEICRVQQINKENKEEFGSALYFHREPGKNRQGVGKCTFEHNKPRCKASHPDYEEFNMLQFLNGIKVKGPNDFQERRLNDTERKKIQKIFYQKTPPSFESIAKKIAGRNNYACKSDTSDEAQEKPYKFNYRMSHGVPNCPTTALLTKLFGDDWRTGMAEVYTGNGKGRKTINDIVNEVWNVLDNFDSKAKRKNGAKSSYN